MGIKYWGMIFKHFFYCSLIYSFLPHPLTLNLYITAGEEGVSGAVQSTVQLHNISRDSILAKSHPLLNHRNKSLNNFIKSLSKRYPAGIFCFNQKYVPLQKLKAAISLPVVNSVKPIQTPTIPHSMKVFYVKSCFKKGKR